MPKILLASLSVGAGHNRAAEALSIAFQQIAPKCELKYIDTLHYLNPAYRRIYASSYLTLVKHFPTLLGIMYKQTGKSSFTSPAARIRISADHFNSRKFTRFLNEYNPDIVVNTHFLAPELIASLKKRNKTKVPQVTCITDYTAHSFWVNPYVDRYYVGADIVKQELIKQKIPQDRIRVTGIPIHPLFRHKTNKSETRLHFGLEPDAISILILSGGMGIGNVAEFVKAMQNIPIQQPVQFIIVAGKNSKLKNQLQQTAMQSRIPLHIIGFTDEMHLLLDAVDIVVTKAGGMTISECLAKGLPMLIVDPIPGQEEKNTAYVIQNNAGITAKKINELPQLLTNLLNNTKRQKELKRNAELLAKPNAAFDIVKDILKHFL
ncbi:MAG: glycosyltransferase [bacterium]|nr:glycosyltransferase [bacterium]